MKKIFLLSLISIARVFLNAQSNTDRPTVYSNFYFENAADEVAMIDKSPFETVPEESLFAEMFVNPLNGPESEDNSKYDKP